MDWFNRRITGIFNFYNKYGDGQCMNVYTSYKSDIQRAIDNFDKKNYANYYQEWENLNKYINEKNNKLKDCYTKRYITVTLIEDDKIKNFLNRCSKNRPCNNRPRQTQRSTSSNPKTKGSCNGRSDCKEPATPKEAKHKTNPTATVVESKAIRSSTQNPDGQGKSHAAVPGSSKGSVNLQTQTSIDHSVPSDLADTKAPEQRGNTHSAGFGQTETHKQSASVFAAEKENIVDPHSSKASSQGISNGGFPSTGTVQLEVLETNKHQGGPLGSKDLIGKVHDERATVVECVEGKTISDNNCAKTSCAENPIERTHARGENVDEHSLQTVVNSVRFYMTYILSGDSVSVDVTTANLIKYFLFLYLQVIQMLIL
ncbi:hypothetical protein PVBG_06126 [Plasmodium vivax Brazil I]|uniref:Variable surface protein Vir18 n=1 Tax=Plasmodium vivax (strain Brazil I) TaxID=1033975 RepID=A0A0J9T213_PLAV1|nr:hypothetical protein PVBG_06126 [Plasmodium vivax Brazil I]